MERQVKGIWIPIEVWKDVNLSWNEKILLMEIDSFTSEGLDCFFSDEYISGMLGIHKTNANKVLSSLIEKGYVEKTRFDGRRRFVKSLLNTPKQVRREHQSSDDEFTKHNNIDEQINIKRESIKRFVPPTVEQVRSYCLERNNGIDPEEFVAFYTSKGWMVGKSKMKDWKSAIITWEKSRKKERKVPVKERKSESVLEHNLRVYDEMFGTNLHSQAYGKKEDYDEQ